MANPPLISYVNKTSVKASHERMGDYHFYFQPANDALFTNNETNTLKVGNIPNESIFVKDAFHDAIIKGENVKELRSKKQKNNEDGPCHIRSMFVHPQWSVRR